MTDSTTTPGINAELEQYDVELRDPRLAAFLGWLVPGLGHLYQGRTAKGLLFMVTILSTFAYGMYLGGGRVVYASTTGIPVPLSIDRGGIRISMDPELRWHYLCQAPMGLVALPAYVQIWRVKTNRPPIDLFNNNFQRPPMTPSLVEKLFSDMPEAERLERFFRTEDHAKNFVYHATEREKWNHDLNYMFELGTVYTMIAGLLNVLAICDARWGPFAPLPLKSPEPAT